MQSLQDQHFLNQTEEWSKDNGPDDSIGSISMANYKLPPDSDTEGNGDTPVVPEVDIEEESCLSDSVGIASKEWNEEARWTLLSQGEMIYD